MNPDTNYVRMVCAINLHRIKGLVNNSWALSVAIDAATHHSTSYLDVRVRLFVPGKASHLQNFHLVALPIFDRHTGEVMYGMIFKLLNVICPDWKVKLIGVSSDGAANMTGQHLGVVTRICNTMITDPIRVWCGAH